MVPGWFNLVDYRNPGAAWGIGASFTPLLALVSLGCAVYVIVNFAELTGGSKLRRQLGALFLGGVLGNFIDRGFRPGGVVDMIEVFIPWPWCAGGKYHYPAFNIADSSIVVGMIVLVGFFILNERATKPEPQADD